MQYLRSLFAILGRTLEKLFRTWEGFLGSLPLWLRAWISVQARVCKDLNERQKDGQKLIAARGRRWLDHEVLIWDYEVRSILRRHLSEDHLERYQKATALDAKRQQHVQASKAALRRALREINVNVEAVQKKTVRPSGGLSDTLLFRTAVTALVVASIGLLFDQVIIPSVTADEGPNTTDRSDPTFGTVQNIVEDPGKVVELTPTVEPTPTSSPTPTPDLPDSQKPVINPPPDPDEDQPDDEAEGNFLDGVTALTNGDFPAAVDAFKAAIATEPGFVRAYYNLAVAYDGIGTDEANQAAVKNYTAAIELWNSLESDGDGLLFEAMLGRGLLLVSFSTDQQADQQAICDGKSDLVEYLERGDVNQRNADAAETALAGIKVDCVEIKKTS